MCVCVCVCISRVPQKLHGKSERIREGQGSDRVETEVRRQLEGCFGDPERK